MSELTLMAEIIRDAMNAAERERNATEELRKANHSAAFDAFKTRMGELEAHLSKLLLILDNEQAYAVDELMDALSLAYTDHRADYRRTPRMAEA